MPKSPAKKGEDEKAKRDPKPLAHVVRMGSCVRRSNGRATRAAQRARIVNGHGPSAFARGDSVGPRHCFSSWLRYWTRSEASWGEGEARQGVGPEGTIMKMGSCIGGEKPSRPGAGFIPCEMFRPRTSTHMSWADRDWAFATRWMSPEMRCSLSRRERPTGARIWRLTPKGHVRGNDLRASPTARPHRSPPVVSP